MKLSSESSNIALVHDWMTNDAGGEKVLLELSKIFPKAKIFTSVYSPKRMPAFKDRDVITSFLQRIPFMQTKRELLVPLTPFAFEQHNLDDFDLVISSSTFAGKGVLTRPNTKHVCYCHTPPRYLWEPALDDRASKGLLSGYRRRLSSRLRIWDRLAADRVDYFIANSEYIQKRIKKYYQRDSEVIYPPVDVDKFKVANEGDVKDYYLFVSRLVKYKKCDLVIETFNRLGLPLVVIGNGPEKARLQAMAKSNIKLLGRLSNDELIKYYSEAKAFVFAAEEDFGIVPVEAMASGRPVIAYNGGGARESVVPGLSGVLFDQQSVESLSTAVRTFDDKKFEPEKIRKHAEKFSNQNFQKQIIEFIEKL